jgi:Flp pilus assembly pilin Flp
MDKFVYAAKRFVKGEEGATMVEQGTMLALIAIAAISSVALIDPDHHAKLVLISIAGISAIALIGTVLNLEFGQSKTEPTK